MVNEINTKTHIQSNMAHPSQKASHWGKPVFLILVTLLWPKCPFSQLVFLASAQLWFILSRSYLLA